MKIDLDAPMIPAVGMGGIKLYSTMEELKELLEQPDVTMTDTENGIECDISSSNVSLWFYKANRQLYRIAAFAGYRGKLLGKIDFNTTEKELVKIEPSFIYEDFEEIWKSDKGMLIVTNPATTKPMEICVYVKDMDDKDFGILRYFGYPEGEPKAEMDLDAPIIPYEVMGRIKLYKTIDRLKEILEQPNVKMRETALGIEYTVGNSLILLFNKENRQLYKITALTDYRGKVFGEIGINTTSEEFVRIEPSFAYDASEKLWKSNKKGVMMETDPVSNRAVSISIYVKELYGDDFGILEYFGFV